MSMTLPDDYSERVYAGVLGKVIGVYLGRPFEGWSYQMIQEKLGDIEHYVHDKLRVPLIVTDDISGTFTCSILGRQRLQPWDWLRRWAIHG